MIKTRICFATKTTHMRGYILVCVMYNDSDVLIVIIKCPLTS